MSDHIKPIGEALAAELISEMQLLDFRDLGETMIHHGMHRHRGRISVMMSASGSNFLVKHPSNTRPLAA